MKKFEFSRSEINDDEQRPHPSTPFPTTDRPAGAPRPRSGLRGGDRGPRPFRACLRWWLYVSNAKKLAINVAAIASETERIGIRLESGAIL